MMLGCGAPTALTLAAGLPAGAARKDSAARGDGLLSPGYVRETSQSKRYWVPSGVTARKPSPPPCWLVMQRMAAIDLVTSGQLLPSLGTLGLGLNPPTARARISCDPTPGRYMKLPCQNSSLIHIAPW